MQIPGENCLLAAADVAIDANCMILFRIDSRPRIRLIAMLARLTFLIVSVLAGPVLAAITIDNYSDATNDRFTNSSSFVMAGFDLSGVGQVNANGRWATAISRNVVISAAHWSPSSTVSFYPSNNSSMAAVERTIVSGLRVPGTDLYLAVLDTPLPQSIAHYSYATEMLTGTPPVSNQLLSVDSAGIYQGMNAYLLGLSPKANPLTQDQAVGRNLVTGFSENVPFQTNVDADTLIFQKDTVGSANYAEFEARFASGDSGGPAFVDMGGELRLIGTNAFIYDPNTFETGGIGSGINYVGNQASFIGNFITANAVPEPGAALLLGTCAFSICFRRQKR